MSDATDRAEALLERIEDGLPFKVNTVTAPDVEPVLGTIRDAQGGPVFMPHPESLSILQGRRDAFDFIVEAPVVIRELLDEIASNSGEKS